MANRTVERVVKGMRTLEGGGFMVRRPFPTHALSFVDPFLLLDEMGPMDVAPGEAKGAPDHPHRGFETVTYLLSGEMEHRDSAGHAGRLSPGDVQWMTAGAGVVHSEMPSAAFQRKGGRMHGFQIWVNLPRRDKLMAPRYQEVPAGNIPVGREGGVTARVIAGEALGAKAVIDTRTPISYVHFSLAAGARHVQPVPAGHNAMVWIFAGPREGELDIYAHDGDAVELSAEQPTELLLLTGQPLGEPVARYGPFVMNTPAELEQAFDDYRTGRMGRISS